MTEQLTFSALTKVREIVAINKIGSHISAVKGHTTAEVTQTLLCPKEMTFFFFFLLKRTTSDTYFLRVKSPPVQRHLRLLDV